MHPQGALGKGWPCQVIRVAAPRFSKPNPSPSHSCWLRYGLVVLLRKRTHGPPNPTPSLSMLRDEARKRTAEPPARGLLHHTHQLANILAGNSGQTGSRPCDQPDNHPTGFLLWGTGQMGLPDPLSSGGPKPWAPRPSRREGPSSPLHSQKEKATPSEI